jgi:ribosome-associated toxin RatA of RatAB toxin-antitoxin module
MFAHMQSTGGRTAAHRFVLSGLLTAGLCLTTPAASTDAPLPAPQVSVEQANGVYRVRAQFVVPQTPAAALTVLTDYEQIPRFMPEVKSSVVRERSAGRVIVEQEAVARMMMFSKRIYLRLEVRADDTSVHFRDSSGRSFTSYEGTWRLRQHDGRTMIRYELDAAPAFDVPSFLLTRLLKRDANQMIDRLRTEIAARGR